MKKYLKDVIYLILFLWILAIVLQFLSGCNPTKQVLKDPAKFDIVKNEVIRRGYCVNDTTIISKSDTIVTTDTITDTQIEVWSTNDSVYIYKNKYRNILKKVIIRDTIKAIVIDNTRVKLLQADSAALSKKMNEYKEKAEKRLGWLIFLILCIAFALYLRYKK